MAAENPIDDKALDSLSVAPAGEDMVDERQSAGQDKSIARRLEKHPESEDAKLDNALDESMDASDPPAQTQPGRNDPAPSSGFDEEAERQQDAKSYCLRLLRKPRTSGQFAALILHSSHPMLRCGGFFDPLVRSGDRRAGATRSGCVNHRGA